MTLTRSQLIKQKVTERRRQAMQKIKVGARYRNRRTGPDGLRAEDVIVTRFHEATGRVWWQRVSGPSVADPHRNLDVEDFTGAYYEVDQ